MTVPRFLALIAGVAIATGIVVWRRDRLLALWYWLLAASVFATSLVLP